MSCYFFSIKAAKNDVKRFISDPKALYIWSKEYFTDLLSHLKIK